MENIFNQPYKRDSYQSFLTKFLPDDYMIENENVLENINILLNKIENAHLIGHCESLELSIYEMYHSSENDPRITVAREAFKILSQYSKKRALVFFISKNPDIYRFSLITIDLKLEENKIKNIISNPKRYSYLLGKDSKLKTFQDRLLKILNNDFDEIKRIVSYEDIQERFSVEPVTNEFFIKYKELFDRILKFLKKDPIFQQIKINDPELTEDLFARKLLGQIVFLYFLQKKKWLGGIPDDSNNWTDGRKDFLRWGLNHCIKNESNIYFRFLEPLFYNGLNNNAVFLEFFNNRIKVPFLNGGLFESLYDTDQYKLGLNDSLFTNKNETGIFDIFDCYNFTIDENTDFEQDVAIDPEMLGKVFENLIDSEERSAHGSFYTPREIVDYMTKESLRQHLINKLKLTFDEDKVRKYIEALFEYKDNFVDKKELKNYGNDFESQFYAIKDIVGPVLQSLRNIKIVDPAIGSGAFSVGILHEIVSIKHYLETQFLNKDVSIYKLKKEIIQDNIYGVDLDPGAVEIAKLRLWLSLVVDSDFPEPLPNLEYKIMQGNSLIERIGDIDFSMKSELEERIISIKKDIEQVDLIIKYRNEEIALISRNVMISKESVDIFRKNTINDEITIQKKKKSVLENKLKQARNSTSNNLQIEEDNLITELEDLKNKIYNTNDKKQKIVFREQIENHVFQILEKEYQKIEEDLNIKKGNNIGYLIHPVENNKLKAEFEKFEKQKNKILIELDDIKQKFSKKNRVRPFFPWHLYFAEVFKNNNGFDIVIGNPPYVQLQKFKGNPIQKAYKDQNFQTFDSMGDIYGLFYEKGIQLLKDHSHLCFITSNKWMRARYGEKLRKFFSELNPKILIDLGPGVFKSATVDTNILLIEKNENQISLKALTYYSDLKSINEAMSNDAITLKKVSHDAWFIGNSAEISLKEKIERIGKPLKDWDVNIYRGVLTGLNEAFIIDTPTKERLCAEDPKSAEILKPILRGRDIKRYSYEWAGLWIIATFPVLHIDIDQYPAIKKFLLDFGKDRLEQEGNTLPDGTKSRKKTSNKWFETQDQIGYYKEFEKEKIVYPETTQKASFYLDKKKLYIEKTGFILLAQDHLSYLQGVLASKLMFFQYTHFYTGVELGLSGFQYNKHALLKVPIPSISVDNHSLINLIETLVNEILSLKKDNINADTSQQEKQIDQLVYQLYDLTEEEIALVEKR